MSPDCLSAGECARGSAAACSDIRVELDIPIWIEVGGKRKIRSPWYPILDDPRISKVLVDELVRMRRVVSERFSSLFPSALLPIPVFLPMSSRISASCSDVRVELQIPIWVEVLGYRELVRSD